MYIISGYHLSTCGQKGGRRGLLTSVVFLVTALLIYSSIVDLDTYNN